MGAMMRGYGRVVGWAVRLRFITVMLRARAVRRCRSTARSFLASGFLPVADIARSLLAIELAARLAALRHRGGDQRDRDTAAQAARGAERLRRRRTHSGQRSRRAQRRADDQLRSEIEALDVAAEARAVDQQGARERSRHPLLVHRRERPAQCDLHRDRARTTPRSRTSRPSSRRRCGGCPRSTNVSSGATLNRPELRIYPRRDLAVRLGVSTEACRRRSASRPSATSARRSRNSMPAIA